LLSCAVNACVAPARTFALVGLMLILSCGGGGGGGGGFFAGPVPAQPTSSSKRIRTKAQEAEARFDNRISSFGQWLAGKTRLAIIASWVTANNWTKVQVKGNGVAV
jgi:hypothetical protein